MSFVVLPFFFFGLVILGLAAVGVSVARRAAVAPVRRLMQELGVPEGGTSVEREGRSFTAKYTRGGKNTPPSMRITGSVDEDNEAVFSGAYRELARERVEVRPALVLRRETGTDRLGKRLGLNREVQTGDAGFDDRVYVESGSAPEDDVRRTLADERVRRAVCALLDAGAKRVELDPAGLSATYDLRGEAFGAAAFDATAGLLAQAASALPLFKAGRAHKPQGPGAILAPVIAGVVVMPILLAVGGRGPLDSDATLVGLGGGLVLWALIVLGLALSLRGRSDSLRRISILAFAALFIVPAGGRTAVVAANRELDESPAVDHATTVARVWSSRSKNSTSYYVDAASWRPGEKTVTLSVSSAFASRAKAGSKIVVTTHAGKLGWEWVDTFRLTS